MKKTLLAIIGVALLQASILHAEGSILEQMRRSAEAQGQAPAQPAPTGYVSTDFATFNRYFSNSSRLTDMQKDALFDSKFKGGLVRWTGRVVEVEKGMLGGLHVLIKHTGESLVSDVTLDLRPSEENKAMMLHKGQAITYQGKLESWGGVMDHYLDEGVIIEAR